MAITITIDNSAVLSLLARLQERTSNMSPVLSAVGEDILERTKQRFSTATAPDGTPWAPNSQITLIRYLEKRGGFAGKSGKINAKGQKLAINKKPLMGETGDLARQFFVQTSAQDVTIGSTMIYAAMQQFGGTRSKFPHLWGDIPARPFLPVTKTGDLYPQEQEQIVSMLQDYLGTY